MRKMIAALLVLGLAGNGGGCAGGEPGAGSQDIARAVDGEPNMATMAELETLPAWARPRRSGLSSTGSRTAASRRSRN